MGQRSRVVETRDQAIRRLAAVAEERGIRVYVYPQTGEHYATSASTPGLLHRVTLWSCDCPGFCRHGRCSHHSALLAELDELPPLPEPPDPVAMVARRAERVATWEENNLVHANTLLAAVIARQDAGETVPYAKVREAVDAVAIYQAATSTPVALAA